MDEGARRWLLNTARSNFWRVCHWMELEDLIQDGYMHFVRVCNRYPGSNPSQRMALFKVVYKNHLNVLSQKRTRKPELSYMDYSTPEDPDGFERILPPSKFTDLTPLTTAPEPIRKVLSIFGSTKGLLALRQEYKCRGRQRETRNERLCKLCGLDPNQFDLPTLLKNYLRSQRC